LDEERLLADLETLATIGASADGAVSRPAYSAADLEAREWIESQMRALGMDVRRDPAGNSVGTYAGMLPRLNPIALGSHTDTVPTGGRYDGALGVMAAIACIRTLRRVGQRLRHPIEIINFAAEEATMAAGTLGSRAMAGLDLVVLNERAWDGLTVADHLVAAGLDPSGLAKARRPKGCVAAYLELHIEQGSVLEDGQNSIGIVDGIVGIRRYKASFRGRANHAGTTPMARREDALVRAAPFVLDVRDVADARDAVATVGAVTVHPGAPNVIPGQVDLSVEVRSLDDSILDSVERDLLRRIRGREASLSRLSSKPPVRSSSFLVDGLCAICEQLGLRYLRLASGAGHDAASMAALTDQAMVFVPSRGGISHSPAEYTDPDSCIAGAKVLFASLSRFDSGLDP
jgi:N-carbamoyl-L-amino-acid hydrolase